MVRVPDKWSIDGSNPEVDSSKPGLDGCAELHQKYKPQVCPCDHSPDLNMNKHLVVICICCSNLCCGCISICVQLCYGQNWGPMCQTICLQQELQDAYIHMVSKSVEAHPDLEHTQICCILCLPFLALILMHTAETTFTSICCNAAPPGCKCHTCTDYTVCCTHT